MGGSGAGAGAGGVEKEEEGEREAAVARRAASRVVGCGGELGSPRNGFIFPRMLQRRRGAVEEVGEGGDGAVECRFVGGGERGEPEMMPSKLRKWFGGGGWVSLRMMRRRRPGAGRQGVEEGMGVLVWRAVCFWCW